MELGRKLKPLKERKTNSFTFEYPIHDPPALELMEKFYKVLKREGFNLNEGMKQAIELYVERHGDGNWQTELDSYQPGGTMSEGQLEQQIIRHFQALERDIKRSEILAKVKEQLKYPPSRLPAVVTGLSKQLRDLGVRVWA